MKKVSFGAMAILVAVLFSSAAHALAERTWVSATGTDAGTCPSNAPCATINFALSNTKPGGVISCLSSGAFGTVTIDKSVTINCTGNLAGTGSGNNGGNLIIDTIATDRVILKGLDIRTGTSAYALNFTGAGTLVLDQVNVTGILGDVSSAMVFQPSGAGRLVITDSTITNGGGASAGGGVVIRPQPGGTAQVTVERSTVAASVFGIAVDGNQSTGGINMTISDSVLSSNLMDGILATSSASGAPIGVTVINSRAINNGFGIRSIGSNVTVRVEGSKIVGNGTGLSGGGALLTGGGNTVQANGTNGGFTGSYPLQ